MTDLINHIDHRIFLWIQDHCRVQSLDLWLALVRDKHFWLPLYVFILAWLAFDNKKVLTYVLVTCLLIVAISDQFSSNYLKKKISRERPCKEISLKNRFVPVAGCSGGKSFPSSHATNHAALGTFFYLFFRRKWTRGAGLFIFWFLLVGFAQIYIGVHYPFDVLAGFSLGILWGVLGFKGYQWVSAKTRPIPH